MYVKKLSIVMPVYNTPIPFLSEAINSILNQSFRDYEFIIIDDGSGDEIRQYLNKLEDDRIILIQNKENLGITKSLNIGLKAARGKYIARMDADDVSLPNRLEKQYIYMEEHPDVILCGTREETFGAKKKHIYKKFEGMEGYRVKMLFTFPGPCHSSVVFRHDKLIEHCILYDEKLYYAQDYGMYASICMYGRVYILNDILIRRRFHENQISKAHRERQIQCFKITQRKLLIDLLGNITEDELDMHHFYSSGYYRNATISTTVVNWFDRIEKANSKRHIYNQKKLKKKIEQIKKALIYQTFTKEMKKGEKIRLLYRYLSLPTAIKATIETVIAKIRGSIHVLPILRHEI